MGAKVYLEAVELVEAENVLVGPLLALLADHIDELGVPEHLHVLGCQLLVYVELVAEAKGVVRCLAELLDKPSPNRVAKHLDHQLKVGRGALLHLVLFLRHNVQPGCKPEVVYWRDLIKLLNRIISCLFS